MSEAWFARRFPLDNPRKSMTPVHWKGWAAIGAFSAAMLAGGLGFLLLSLTGGFVLGLVLFVSIAGGATYALLWLVHRKGDPTRVAEHPVKQPAPAEENIVDQKPAAEPAVETTAP